MTENERVQAFALALGQGDDEALAAALYASHASLRDDFEASWPEADFLVERAKETPGVIGARMVHVIDEWDFYSNSPGQILQVWSGGIGVWGGILGGFIGGAGRRREAGVAGGR